MLLEAALQFVVGRIAGRHLIHDNKVNTLQFLAVATKGFPDYAFDSVTIYCSFAMFFGNRQPQSCNPQIVVPAQHCKPLVPAACGFIEDTRKRRSVQQPVVFRKPVRVAAFQIG